MHDYAQIHGLKMYYEVHGTGKPLILLHGGAGATEMYSEVIPILAKGHQVIALDLQAHGRTADIDRPLRYELLADDIAALVGQLHLDKVDVMGYSMGGGVALRVAIQHPQLVRKLVLVSTPFKRDGWYPEVREAMGHSEENVEPMKQTPIYELYARIAPRPEDFPVLFKKLGEMLRQDYDWSQEVTKLKIPVLLVAGDADSVRTAHAVEFFELLGGGRRDAGWDGSGMSTARLCILPGVTHYNIFNLPQLATIASQFLDVP
jgi:pimeloyl-ACP methyl ester carboxylesterase